MGDEPVDMKKNSIFTVDDDDDDQPMPDDADKEMAAKAYKEFDQSKYEACTAVLKDLLAKRPKDYKIKHNLAVTEYYMSKCKKTETFNEKLAEVCKEAKIDFQDLESLDDVDSCVVLYNQAVILYHRHQYYSAIAILEKVFQIIEPLDENLSKNICFMLLELYICISQQRKALGLIAYLENALFSNIKTCSKTNIKEKDNQKEETEEDGSLNETSKRRLQLSKARLYAMMKTSKACKREIKNLMSSGTQTQNIPASYLKSQLEYQRGNYRKAAKLLSSIPMPADVSNYFLETGDHLPTIFYNNLSCIHFYMGKPNLGCLYLNKAVESFDSEMASITDAKESKLNSRSIHLMSSLTHYQILYNVGMQRLQAQKYLEAFNCFKKVIPIYHSNPRIWLRMAECCIHLHKSDSASQFTECKNTSFIKQLIGSGPHRKLILNSSSPDKLHDASKSNTSNNPDSPSLHLAYLCLKNALYLIGESSTTGMTDSVSSVQAVEESDSSENNILAALPSNFMQGVEILSLRNAILIACSYVSLCLGDILMTHEYAKTVLAQQRISGVHKFLAHLYAGEALLLMDRITEALEHFNYQCPSEIELTLLPANSSDTKYQTKFDSKSSEKNDDGSRPVGTIPNWFPNVISSAKFIMQYNLAVAYSVREEWNKALECILQMNSDDRVPPQALSLLIYVQSHQGTADDVKTYVKQSLAHRNF